jgi:hypothetical protein
MDSSVFKRKVSLTARMDTEFTLTHWHTPNNAIRGKLTSKAHIIFLDRENLCSFQSTTRVSEGTVTEMCDFRGLFIQLWKQERQEIQRGYLYHGRIELAKLKSFSVSFTPLLHSPDVQSYHFLINLILLILLCTAWCKLCVCTIIISDRSSCTTITPFF